MNDVVIRAEGLCKKYVIGHEHRRGGYTALRDVLAGQARSLARSTADLFRGRPLVSGDETEEFWALRDVDFEIRRGDVVGVIGHNGAGKSTLLKILSRITEPSAGRVTLTGRVGSLLEVGTGFHPELTGRENVYLNGAILGMTRREVRRKFDEIVAFSGVEKFVDTPVKHYSSGMKVRLAFSVAAHLEPEILIVDEVLAVGDAEFQRKCLGKMQDVAGEGRTVLFVSHNMSAVARLCERGIVFGDGKVEYSGPAAEAVERYARQALAPLKSEGRQLVSSEKVRLISWRILDRSGKPMTVASASDRWSIELSLQQLTDLPKARAFITLRNSYGDLIFTSTDESKRTNETDQAGYVSIFVNVPADIFKTGTYDVFFKIGQNGREILPETLLARVAITCDDAHGSLRNEGERWPGVVAPRLVWSHRFERADPYVTGSFSKFDA